MSRGPFESGVQAGLRPYRHTRPMCAGASSSGNTWPRSRGQLANEPRTADLLPRSFGFFVWMALAGVAFLVVLAADMVAALMLWRVTGPWGLAASVVPAAVFFFATLSRGSSRILGMRWGSLVVGLAVPVLLFMTDLPERLYQTRFDPATWKAAPRARSDDRSRQIDDLLASRALDHKSREEVLGLLGPDDSVIDFGKRRRLFEEWESEYWLGPQAGLLSMGSGWLLLRFTADGHVSEYQKTVRD